MKRVLFFVIFMFFISVSPALAQSNDTPVAITKPETWNNDTSDLNAHRVAVWVDPKTENRIEVLMDRIVRAQFADIYFKAFQSQLIDSQYHIVTPSAEKKVPLVNTQERTGTWTEYEYLAADIPIIVATYTFVVNENAIIIVGYFARSNSASGIEAMTHAISQMIDK